MSTVIEAGQTYIYALTDTDNVVRYVGQSVNPWARLSGHILKHGRTPVSAWGNELRAAGRAPVVHLLKRCPAERARFWERFYIEAYCSPLLLNTVIPRLPGEPARDQSRYSTTYGKPIHERLRRYFPLSFAGNAPSHQEPASCPQ